MPRQNEWWYQVWMKQKFEHQRIQNDTKLSLKKSLSQQVIRRLRESWIWILVGIMNRGGKNDRNHEYQDSNDSASTPDTTPVKKLKRLPFWGTCTFQPPRHFSVLLKSAVWESVYVLKSTQRSHCIPQPIILTTQNKCLSTLLPTAF